MLSATVARLRAAWIALTHTHVIAPAYVPAEPYVAPAMLEQPEPDSGNDLAAQGIGDIRQFYAARRCPVLDALNAKPDATLADWRQWIEAHEWGDIPMTHSQVQDVREMVRRDLQCLDIQDADLLGPRGLYRPMHRGLNDRDTRYRYRPAGAEDAEPPCGLLTMERKLLAFLNTRGRPVSGKGAAKALSTHHTNISRTKDRLLAKGLIVQEQVGREVLFGVPRQSRGASRRVA